MAGTFVWTLLIAFTGLNLRFEQVPNLANPQACEAAGKFAVEHGAKDFVCIQSVPTAANR